MTSFLEGRRRRVFAEAVGFVILEMRLACLMRRLSALVVGKSESDRGLDFDLVEVVDVVLLDLRIDFVGAEVRWEGCVGAILDTPRSIDVEVEVRLHETNSRSMYETLLNDIES